jgi:predicted nucleotidyltransferase
MSDLEAVLRRIILSLQEQGARFAIVGGLAVSARTEPRFTRDADLCVAVSNDAEAEALVHALRGVGYELVALVEQEAVGRLATARLSDPRTSEGRTAVDLLFASSGIEPEVVEQAEDIELFDGIEAPVATVPALIALKVLSRNDRTRPQDRIDALSLLAVATPDELTAARDLLKKIEQRGYARERDLESAFDALVAESDSA